MILNIEIYALPLNTRKEEIEKLYDSSEYLHKAVTIYSEMLASKDIETFSIDRNIAATESGYAVAIYDATGLN